MDALATWSMITAIVIVVLWFLYELGNPLWLDDEDDRPGGAR